MSKRTANKAPIQKARQAALRSLQKLRRAEEALPGSGLCQCISCGSWHHWKSMDGGHFIPRTFRITELEPTNIWPQCKRCNGFLEGNTIAYDINLRKRIGDARVDRLIALRMASTGSEEHIGMLSDEDKRKLVMRFTADDYIEIKREFEKRTRKVTLEKGIG